MSIQGSTAKLRETTPDHVHVAFVPTVAFGPMMIAPSVFTVALAPLTSKRIISPTRGRDCHEPEFLEFTVRPLIERDAVVLEFDPDQVAWVRESAGQNAIVVGGDFRHRRLHIMIGKTAIWRGVGSATVCCIEDGELFAANGNIARRAIAAAVRSEPPIGARS